MKGRQVIKTNKNFESKEALFAFMQEHWNKEEYGDFFIGKPTPGSISEYICLPATQRFMVITYPKKNKVVLTVCDAPAGLKDKLITSIPTKGNLFASAAKMAVLASSEKERKGPAEDILLAMTAHMRDILGA